MNCYSFIKARRFRGEVHTNPDEVLALPFQRSCLWVVPLFHLGTLV